MTADTVSPLDPFRLPTLDGLLSLRAREVPDAPFLRFVDGDLTFAAVDATVAATASGFERVGVRPGDVVPVLLPNGREFVIAWLALCRLGAIAALINTALRGAALAHGLGSTGASLAVVHGDGLAAVDEVADQLTCLRRVVVVGGTVESCSTSRFECISFDDCTAVDESRDVTTRSGHTVTDPAMVLFTSGTTGPSKGCVLSHRYAVRQAQLMVEHLRLRPDDVLYCPFPLFHIDATVLTVAPALVMGATAAIGLRFSASGFWAEVRRFDATVFDFMGATLTMLHKQPRRPNDSDNRVRLAWGVPVPAFADDFEQRFGLQLVELYGSTDAGVPIYQPIDEPRRPGSCGRPIDAYDVRLLDSDGCRVAVGDVGEIVVRPNEPSLMSDGYWGMPEATLESRRNLWFHTGDLARQDLDGNVYFVGRRSDSIRRRGENISAFEVEEVIKLHPCVLDAAAYGVPSEMTEDDVMVAVVARPGRQIEPGQLVEFCSERMAHHMVPRYVDVVDTLPRTPTEKVEKSVLRDRGTSATTWDREHHDRR